MHRFVRLACMIIIGVTVLSTNGCSVGLGAPFPINIGETAVLAAIFMFFLNVLCAILLWRYLEIWLKTFNDADKSIFSRMLFLGAILCIFPLVMLFGELNFVPEFFGAYFIPLMFLNSWLELDLMLSALLSLVYFHALWFIPAYVIVKILHWRKRQITYTASKARQ